MKNIAIIIYSLKGGGAERVASLLSQGLSKKYNIFMIVFDSDDMVFPYNGKLIDIDVKSSDNLLIKVINVIKRSLKVKKLKTKYKIQHSISILGSANIVNVFSKTNDEVTISLHSDIDADNEKILGLLNKFLFKKADNIIGVSKGIINKLITNYELKGKNVDFIHNPIDIRKIHQLSKEPVDDKYIKEMNKFTIVNMGRLTDAKGQWHLIRALKYIKKTIKDIRLIILGDGELNSYLKELVKGLDLQENIIFLGYQKNPFKFIAKCDLFVFTSIYEGFGNVIVEAMACGVPVISTDCKSGPREILAPTTDITYQTKDIEYAEYGVLVPTCDGEHYDCKAPLTKEEIVLAQGIIELYNDKKLRNSYIDRGTNRAKEFDIEQIIREWEKIIN